MRFWKHYTQMGKLVEYSVLLKFFIWILKCRRKIYKADTPRPDFIATKPIEEKRIKLAGRCDIFLWNFTSKIDRKKPEYHFPSVTLLRASLIKIKIYDFHMLFLHFQESEF